MKLFHGHYSLFFIPVALWLSVGNAQAAVNCKASIIPTVVNLGNNITPANADNGTTPPATATLTYECKSTFINPRKVSICLGVDGGDYSASTISPRYMKITNPTPTLAFIMTYGVNNILWGSKDYPNNSGLEFKRLVDIPGGKTTSFTLPINISLAAGYDNISATPGTYTNNLNGYLRQDVGTLGGDGTSRDCLTQPKVSTRFPFKVQATVISSCEITANPVVIGLGSKPASEPNLSSNGKIGVTCTKTTSYNIGLAPTTPYPNNNTSGAGRMRGTDNIPTVPYQLRSTAGPNGTKWGNDGSTFATLTNGVTGTSDDGSEKSHTVYVTVPSADFKPDDYSDKVTINVYY